ncbi:hypothetical protein J4211_05860 [Candidatus Woesearchaeota archaeon]|nr:hypothetical protein [Candidatus Woesearchaeota archaeon]
MTFKAAPLTGSFMILSIIGFLISAIAIVPRALSWGFAFCLVFGIMFIASLIAMTYADVDDILMLESKKHPNRKKPKR